MSLIELLEKNNESQTYESYEEYYKAYEKYVNEYRDLCYHTSESSISDEDKKRIAYIKSELSSVDGKEDKIGYPYYVFVTLDSFTNKAYSADTIEELTQQGLDLNNGVLFKVYDTFSDVELFKPLTVNIDFLKAFIKEQPISIKSKYNTSAPNDNDIYSIDYYKAGFDINKELFTAYYEQSERGKVIADLISRKYDLYVKNFDGYIYLISNYKKTGEIYKKNVLLYLLDSCDYDAINKYLESDFTDEELEYYFNKIKNKYQSAVLKKMIDRLSGNVNNYLGVDISLLGKLKDLLSSKQSEDLKVINILQNQGIVDFIDDWLKNYNISSEEEPTKCNIDDVIKITDEFYKIVDNTGVLDREFRDLLSRERIIFYTPEQKEQVENKYGVRLTSSCYNVKEDKLFVESDGTYNTFTVLVHEIMHYISFKKGNKINNQIAEFPSIYYEHLTEFFSKKKGISTVFSKERLSNSLKHYEVLKSLSSYTINIDDYRDNSGGIDYKAIEKDLADKNGSQDYIEKFIIDCYTILDSMDSSIIFSYVFSTALAEYCMNNNIFPNDILDVCINLSDFNDVYGLLEKLHINLSEERDENYSR